MLDECKKLLKDPVVLGGFVQAFREQWLYGGLYEAVAYHGPLYKVRWTEVTDEEGCSGQVQVSRR